MSYTELVTRRQTVLSSLPYVTLSACGQFAINTPLRLSDSGQLLVTHPVRYNGRSPISSLVFKRSPRTRRVRPTAAADFMPSQESSSPNEPLLHVVLHQPDIPPNTGNIGRTCVAVGAKLWLIRPLGFSLDEKNLRRAGMDYWPLLDWEAVDSWEEVQERLPDRQVWCLTKKAERLVWDATFERGDILLFGSETSGLPDEILDVDPHRNLKLPMHEEVRSLNLASTANTIVYEAVRQFGGLE